jgi:hypothetical protein
MRKGCLFSITISLLVIGCFLVMTRSQKIKRGVTIDPLKSGNFTYEAWSYGNWVESKRWGARIYTYAPPYTLVIAIQPHQQNVEEIELISAKIFSEAGTPYSILSRVRSGVDEVEPRPSSGITLPYAAFAFEFALDSTENTKIELSFRISSDPDDTVFTQTLEVRGFETKTRSFTFLEAISGI